MRPIFIFLALSYLFEVKASDELWDHNKNILADNLQKKVIEQIEEEDIKKIDLSLDNELINFDKFKAKKINIPLVEKKKIYFRALISLGKGTLIYKNKTYYKLPRSILAWIKYSTTSKIAYLLNTFGEIEYSILTRDITNIDSVSNSSATPSYFIPYRPKEYLERRDKKLKLRLKIDAFAEYLDDRYLEELVAVQTDGARTDNQEPFFALSGGFGLHLLTEWKFPINIGLQAFYQGGNWFGGFSENEFQCIYFGPEIQLRLNEWENYSWKMNVGISQSILHQSQTVEGSPTFSLNNQSIKFSTELEFIDDEIRWSIGAYYRLIESSINESLAFEDFPQHRKNSNAFGLYLGRSFTFEVF